MQESDKIAFSKSMGELGIAFGKPVERETLAVYFKHLSGMTIYQVSRAIDDIISNDDRFPSLSRVKSMACINKKYPPKPMQDVPQVEEVVLSNDLPKTKDDFFKAMKKLCGDVDVS